MTPVNVYNSASIIAPSFKKMSAKSVFLLDFSIDPPVFLREDLDGKHDANDEVNGVLSLPEGISEQEALDCVREIIAPLVQLFTGFQLAIASANIHQTDALSGDVCETNEVERKLRETGQLDNKEWRHVSIVYFRVTPTPP